MPSRGLSKYIETNPRRPFAFTSCKTFLKNKKRSGASFPASFSAWFLKKNFYFVFFYYLTRFHCLVAFTLFDIGQHVYRNSLSTSLWRHKFWELTELLKNIFHHFKRTSIEADKTIFFGRWESDFNIHFLYSKSKYLIYSLFISCSHLRFWFHVFLKPIGLLGV